VIVITRRVAGRAMTSLARREAGRRVKANTRSLKADISVMIHSVDSDLLVGHVEARFYFLFFLRGPQVDDSGDGVNTNRLAPGRWFWVG